MAAGQDPLDLSLLPIDSLMWASRLPIERACEKSGQAVSDHFNLQVKMITAGKGAKRKTEDYHLSRHACYLIQNAGPEKPIVALGQSYFAVQTRRQELADELAPSTLPKDQKRLIYRKENTGVLRQMQEFDPYIAR